MKNLTKKQRHQVFKKAFKFIESGKHKYMCNAIEEALTKKRKYCYFDKISTETSIMCPINYGHYFFSCISASVYNGEKIINALEAKNLRLMILQFCIEMTK